MEQEDDFQGMALQPMLRNPRGGCYDQDDDADDCFATPGNHRHCVSQKPLDRPRDSSGLPQVASSESRKFEAPGFEAIGTINNADSKVSTETLQFLGLNGFRHVMDQCFLECSNNVQNALSDVAQNQLLEFHEQIASRSWDDKVTEPQQKAKDLDAVSADAVEQTIHEAETEANKSLEWLHRTILSLRNSQSMTHSDKEAVEVRQRSIPVRTPRNQPDRPAVSSESGARNKTNGAMFTTSPPVARSSLSPRRPKIALQPCMVPKPLVATQNNTKVKHNGGAIAVRSEHSRAELLSTAATEDLEVIRHQHDELSKQHQEVCKGLRSSERERKKLLWWKFQAQANGIKVSLPQIIEEIIDNAQTDSDLLMRFVQWNTKSREPASDSQDSKG
eukprot:GHVQ01027438.1.p1 GENE.GHVQ01027438.1~~GHVQ01027438.1.p1  ORF type:complete len:389 (+),score=41.68 GHVQ01027438.1:5172-6338(+)